ncbi:hypothetical protein ABTZ03_39145 [Kitasatospora sp. NPDC096077]|uniref:hypothetical protein n=1 Tax=Kitasatospora sp. NPDC096077 TaxID=3155544 RepID=UPI003323ADB5
MSHIPLAPGGSEETALPAPHRTGWSRIVGLAVAAAVVTAVGSVGAVYAQAKTPSSHASSTRDTLLEHLKCSGKGTLKLAPGLTDTQQTISGTIVGTLSACESDDGSQSGIKSGKIMGSGSGNASCNGLATYSGTVTITWYGGPDQTGTVLGTSTISTNGAQTGETDAKDNTASDDAIGQVTQGLLGGNNVEGWALPTSDVTTCSTSTPLTSIAGQGEMVFSGLL